MRQVPRVLRIRHVDDRRAVRLLFSRQRVHCDATVVANIRDPAIALPFDLRLVRAASLQIVVADKLHVAAVGALFAPIAGLSLPFDKAQGTPSESRGVRRDRGAQKDCHRHTCQVSSRHGKLLRFDADRDAPDRIRERRSPRISQGSPPLLSPRSPSASRQFLLPRSARLRPLCEYRIHATSRIAVQRVCAGL